MIASVVSSIVRISFSTSKPTNSLFIERTTKNLDDQNDQMNEWKLFILTSMIIYDYICFIYFFVFFDER